jgi:hypothetical protein
MYRWVWYDGLQTSVVLPEVLGDCCSALAAEPLLDAIRNLRQVTAPSAGKRLHRIEAVDSPQVASRVGQRLRLGPKAHAGVAVLLL